MAKKVRRLARDGLHYLDAVFLDGAVDELTSAISDADESFAPVRCWLQAKSDFDFANQVAATIASQLGVDDEIANAMAGQLILDPAVAFARSSAGHEVFLQAIVIERDFERQPVPIEDDVRLVLRASGIPKVQVAGQPLQPPAITDVSVDVQLVDAGADRNLLLRELTDWAIEFAAGGPSERAGHTRSVVVLGSPSNIALRDVPDNWREVLAHAADILGSSARIEAGNPRFNGRVDRSTTYAIVVDPFVANLWAKEDREGIAVDESIQRGMSFDDAFDAVMALLIPEQVDEEPESKRTLAANDIFYHRKVGDSRGGHDNFSGPSNKPLCNHNAGYVHFRGPKSRKGMARVYSNFDNKMLYHCDKFPNCGVYQVRA